MLKITKTLTIILIIFPGVQAFCCDDVIPFPSVISTTQGMSFRNFHISLETRNHQYAVMEESETQDPTETTLQTYARAEGRTTIHVRQDDELGYVIPLAVSTTIYPTEEGLTSITRHFFVFQDEKIYHPIIPVNSIKLDSEGFNFHGSMYSIEASYRTWDSEVGDFVTKGLDDYKSKYIIYMGLAEISSARIEYEDFTIRHPGMTEELKAVQIRSIFDIDWKGDMEDFELFFPDMSSRVTSGSGSSFLGVTYDKDMNVVPEPSTSLLLMVGSLLTVIGFRRKR